MTEISRRQFAVSLVVVVLVVLLGGRALRADAGGAGPGDPLAQGGAGGAPGALSGAAGATGAGGAETGGRGTAGGVELSTASERPLVHVAGAVRRPGVYELRSGARIRDAVARAGGGRTGADLDGLNLAAKVTDGQQVLVLRRGRAGRSSGAAPAAGASAPAASTAPGAAPADAAAGAAVGAAGATVDVNSADAAQLETLDGVGPAIAAKIIDWRTQNGPFRSVDDLAQVSGIGPKKLEAIRARAST